MPDDIRWQQRFVNFRKATEQLTEFINLPKLNKFEKQGLIQCFEYTFELAWKTMKDFLELGGYSINSPRTAIQTAFQTELITNGHLWIEALEKRNLMAHTYDEKLVLEAESLIKDKYYFLILELCNKLEREP